MIASFVNDWFGWDNGSVLTNLLASLLWVVPTWIIVWRKKLCRVPWCMRIGHHPVDGTTWKVCHSHHQPKHHHDLFHRHKAKHPNRLGWSESHKLRQSQ